MRTQLCKSMAPLWEDDKLSMAGVEEGERGGPSMISEQQGSLSKGRERT